MLLTVVVTVPALTLVTGDPPGLPSGGPPVTAAHPGAPPGGSPPQRFSGPGGLRAAVRPVAADRDGGLSLPAAGDELGWWALGARPGDAAGTVLIAGHVDTPDGGPGLFAALPDLPVGSRVRLTGADGRQYPYTVTARRTHAADELPADLFTGSGPPRLALVTCTGSYDAAAARYRENLVVYAEPERQTSP